MERELINKKFLENGALYGNVNDFLEALPLIDDINLKNEEGDTALCIVSKLRPDLVKILINNGADVNLKGKNNISPLHWAVEFDNTDVIKLLLKHNADTEIKDNLGETPLHWACWTGHHKSLKLLLKFGADKNAKNCGGHTPLDLAIMQSHKKIIYILEDKK